MDTAKLIADAAGISEKVFDNKGAALIWQIVTTDGKLQSVLARASDAVLIATVGEPAEMPESVRKALQELSAASNGL